MLLLLLFVVLLCTTIGYLVGAVLWGFLIGLVLAVVAAFVNTSR